MRTQAFLITAAATQTPPEEGAPAPDRLISGEPQHKTWNLFESPDGKFFAGIWESTPGKWRVVYDEDEYCHILSGHSILTDEDGTDLHLKAGASLLIPAGFSGTWEVVETTRKDYVIYLA